MDAKTLTTLTKPSQPPPRGERRSENRQLLSLPFDHYERYALTQRLVSLLWPRRKGRRPLQILDVGGHSSPLKHFLPNDIVVLTDVQPPGSLTTMPLFYDTYFRATGSRLPLADRSFDLVTAHDTLEHVPSEHRPAFLRDLLRVSRRFVILNGPVYHPQTAQAEQRFVRFLQRALSGESHFLQEHLTLGLPKGEDIENVLKEQALPFISIPNGNLMLWLAANTAKNYVLAFPHAAQLSEVIDRTYNLVLSPQDLGGLCYRQAYVIAKNRQEARTLHRVQATLAPLLDRPPVLDNVEALEALVAALEEHASDVRRATEALQTTLAELRHSLQERDTALADKDATIAERERKLARQREAVARLKRATRDRDALLAENSRHIANLEMALQDTAAKAQAAQDQLHRATSTVGYRLLERVRRPIRWLAPAGTWRRVPFSAFSRGLNVILTRGWRAFLSRLVRVHEWLPSVRSHSLLRAHQPLDDEYQAWLKKHMLTPAQLRTLRRTAMRLTYRPKVSIIVPVYNTDPTWLREAIDSVRAQVYDNWELCIADDGSTRPGVRELLEEYAAADPRIRVTCLKKNRGISAASNTALTLASGEFVGFLDHDDELKPDALFEVVRLLNERRDLDYIYSDEDKKDTDGRLVEPFFKPDWSPDLLMSTNYLCHFSVFRKEIIDRLGGFRQGYDGSQDYDLVLRVTELTDNIAHIAKPLYTWRKVPGSAAASIEAKPFAYVAAKRALKDALARRGVQGEVLDGPFKGFYRGKYAIPGNPRVAIIIPTRDQVDMLHRCIDSIRRKSSYRNYEIVVIDNDSREPETFEYLSSFPGRVIRYPHKFNFARMMNEAAKQIECDALLFLNNDTEVISSEWIEAMLEHGMRPEVAAVGARLLYPNGQIQHEGILVGPAEGLPRNLDHRGYFSLGDVIRNCSAVTAACMLTRPSVFWELDGFEERLRVAYNDVDFCLRARQQGYLIVYTPYALLYHHEGGSRGRTGRTHPPEDEDLFRLRWGKYRDPYYNPNLDLGRSFTIRI